MLTNIHPNSFTSTSRGMHAPLTFGETEQPAASESSRARARRFSRFVRYTTPTPPPGKWRFYWDELKANYKISMALGEQRYRENLKYDRHTRLKFGVFTLLFAGAYAVMRRLRRSFMYVALLGMLAGPIKDFNRTMPEMEEAYRQMRRGNPTRARQIFAYALDDTVYTLMHDLMKPLSVGIGLGLLLGFPSVLRGEGTGFVNRLVRFIGRGIGLKPTHPGIRQLDQFMTPKIAWGDRQCNWLRRHLPFLNQLEI